MFSLTRINTASVAAIMTGLLLCPRPAVAEPVVVRNQEGALHGFLSLRSLDGKLLASGDLVQTIRNGRVTSHLIFHFKDGSIDEETAVFTQNGHFRLISDHHVQKGPSFPRSTDVTIDAVSGKVTVRYKDNGKDEKVETEHMDLPDDLANGIGTILVKNTPAEATAKFSAIVATPKPRLVKLLVSPGGADTFTIVGTSHKAHHFVIKIDIGGVVGAIAPLLGKQPHDIDIWVSAGAVPTFVKSEGQTFEDGPVWRTELSSPVWKK